MGQLWTFLGVALPALAALLVPMPAVDLAYQLRAGAGILETGAIPSVDTWTYTVNGAPWLDQQWGAQALLAGVFQLAGWTGLALLRAGLVALTFWLVQTTLRSMGCARRPAALLALGAFVVAAPALALRPQLFGLVLFAASMAVVAVRARHPRRLWLLPVFAALWSNLHGSFPLILPIVGFAWLDEVGRLWQARAAVRALPKGVQQPGRALVQQRIMGSTGIAIIGAVSALATLVNPFGIDAWRYVVSLASNPSVSRMVSEWRPPSPLEPVGALFYVSLLVGFVVLLMRVRADGNRVRVPIFAPAATLVAFGLLGILSGRGLAWWALVLPVAAAALAHDANLTRLLPRALAPIGSLLAGHPARLDRRSPLNSVVALVLLAAGVALLPAWRPLGAAGVPNGVVSYAPQGIAAKLDALIPQMLPSDTLRGGVRIWVPQTWASYLEMALTEAPGAEFPVDSRIELFPPSVWHDYETVNAAADGWRQVLDRDRVTTVVTAQGQDALRAALEHDGWNKVYDDLDGQIWERRNVAGGPP
jgi:hypothetical protein